MNTLIIEDEAPAARKLEKILKAVRPSINVIAILESVADSLEWFEENTAPDIIFSDIQLADALSFEIYNTLDIKVPIIFTTAYDEYAIQAFRHHSIDYLLKPIKESDVEKALIKYDELSLTSQQPGFEDVLKSLAPKEYKERFLVSSGKKFLPISVLDVAYFYSEDGLSFMKTKDNARFIVNETLDQLELCLDPKYFFRANRQFIVCADSVLSIENYFNQKLIVKLTPSPHTDVLVSKTKASKFKEWMGQ